MNLSFSTNYWNDFNINEFFDIAREYKFAGFEIHDISQLNESDIKNAYHKIMEYKVKISCIDMVSDVSDTNNFETVYEEFKKCLDAAFLAIEQITGHHFELDSFQIQAVTEGRGAVGSSIVKLRYNGKPYSGKGISTDIIGAGINAYINALNKICFEEAQI